MTNDKPEIITEDHWHNLKKFTDARISLGRVGSSLPLRESLDFKLAHAQARDAVHTPFSIDKLANDLAASGIETIKLKSSVTDRSEYLTRPDLGRQLSEESRTAFDGITKGYDICVTVSDGLSSRAIHENALEFLNKFIPMAQRAGINSAPVALVENGRVAVADEIADRLQATLSIILIGERPGLSSPNSMGIYMTYSPKPGTTDEARNCISNVRNGGLTIDEGVQKLAYLTEMALASKKSGVELKDKMTPNYLPFKGEDAMLTE
ncbi:ethanolamine ammonia-lyase subunit EutC [Pseudodesulfovibrio sp. zrk46]|uniref:ethanolamine ammonia-lyase subunit EutC n=1 Tax=Pseudodesulfovibrio sp. zrk46 TaxID=2725288 RepID=UPI001449DD17|nr:ethanolamine ammonia-lyase subunit EutC [Pseudodesulfovibrio sp. zrk46]QJB56792.1 ethanolamine ammonia-lyase subunit EutC [Pseudodesulfovibrio sp. zrk46]